MAKIRSIPLGTYPSGVYNIGPIATPNGLDGMNMKIGRCTTATPDLWPSEATLVTINMLFSYDGGVSYPQPQSFGPQPGGIITTRDGELAEDFFGWRLMDEQGRSPTHMKGTITVENGPIRTYLDVTIL